MQRVPPSLPDDIIAKILSGVPYKSLCCFKCVSKPWLALCSDPSVHRNCPQTLSGFFFMSSTGSPASYNRHFINASGRGPPMVDPSLPFLPPEHRDSIISDCCNGLLLCKRRNAHSPIYFVCNPATKEWMDLPDTETMKTSGQTIRLGFDPTVSSHFTVFLHVRPQTSVPWRYGVAGVDIYSSATGRWTYRLSKWGNDTGMFGASLRTAFLNNTLHLTTCDHYSVVTVDTDGKTWRKIRTPPSRGFHFIGQVQGHLHAVQRNNDKQLSIWVLKDVSGREWILKHTASAPELYHIGLVHAIHPENNLIFLTMGWKNNLISYDMDTRKVNVIQTIGGSSLTHLHPYIPCLSEWLPVDTKSGKT